jgi:hypothetical protein
VLRKFNTLVRLLIVGLLIYPMPIAMAIEQTVNEDFTDSTYQTGLTISGGSQDAYIYSSEPSQYGTTGNSLAITSGTYTFEFTEDVYEVGFVVGAVNNAWSIKWYYADGTDETVSKDAQSNSNLSTMYETIYKSYTDYNAVETNTDKFITKFDVILTDISVLDTLYWQYDDGLTAGIGDPSNLTTSEDFHNGSISIDWDSATGYQYDAERYAIGFDKANPPMYGIATGNVGDSNALNTEYTFTKSYLEQVLNVTVGDTVYFKIRADNDTNSKYSNWTSIASYTIQDVASGVTNLSITNTNYQGLDLSWTQPNTGWATQTSYKIAYGLAQENVAWTYIADIDPTATSYTIDNVNAGDYVFSLYACTQNGSWCHGNQDGQKEVTVNSTTSVTIPVFLGPPMNTAVTQEYNVGVKVDWDVANTGSLTAETYELYFRTDATNEIVVYNITETEYTIPYASISNGTWEFSVRGYSSDDNAYSGFSTEPTLNVFNQKAKDDADAAWQAEQDRLAQEEADRIAKEKAEQERKAEEERIAREKAEEEARIEAERLAEEERIRLEQEEIERQRLQAIEDEKQANFAQTGYMELDTEREARELAEEQARIEEEIKNSISIDSGKNDGDPLSKDEQDQLDLLVDTIIELQQTLDPEEYEVEEEVFEIKEIIIVPTTTTTTTTTIPIQEDFPDELEEVEVNTPTSEDGEQKILPTELTDQEVEILVTEVEETISEVVEVEELTEVFEANEIIIIEEDELEDLSVEQQEEYIEQVEEAVAEVVKELPIEKKVEVVKEIAKVSVQNLATADTQTKAIVKAVVKEVTKVETVAELDQEEKEAVGQVLGFIENAAEDVEIIAEQAATDVNISTALDLYVEKAIENQDVENFTLADVVTEVQVEAFLINPIGELVSVNIELSDVSLESISSGMTTDQKEKAQEVVVPVIIASQIVAQAGALIRRF